MWFVFPQIAGLGSVPRHNDLQLIRKPRVRRALRRLVIAASEKKINEILDSSDDMKFRSSMTLFDSLSKQEIFAEALGTF